MSAEITYEKYLEYKKLTTHINTLLDRLLDAGGLGFKTDIPKNPNYQELLQMGDKIVPYIFSRIIDSHAYHLHLILLHDLTGENPIKEEHTGKFYCQINDWLSWYLTSRYYGKDDIYHGLVT